MKHWMDDTQRIVDFIVKEIRSVCTQFKNRCPGSPSEHAAGIYMGDLLKRCGGCDEVKIESFREHPRAFYDYMYIAAILAIFSAFGFFLSHWISLICGCGSLLLVIYEFVYYREAVDGLFSEKEGTNVLGIRKCSDEIRQRILINGHIDAAWEWRIKYHFGTLAYIVHILLSALGILWYVVLSIVKLLVPAANLQTLALWGLLFVPVWIGLFCMVNYNCVVEGANDNLTGCFIGIGLLKAMEDCGLRLKHTEIGVLLTGSEEAGLRGAKAWSAAHHQDYEDVPTVIYCFDTIQDSEYLMVNYRDMNNTVQSDRALGDLFIQSARELHLPCLEGKVPMFGGSSDSAAFTQGGFRSVGITAMNHWLPDYYHTRKDTVDTLNPSALEATLRIMGRTIEKIDHAGI